MEKKNKKVGSSSHASVEGIHDGPCTGENITRNTSITRMNTVNKAHV